MIAFCLCDLKNCNLYHNPTDHMQPKVLVATKEHTGGACPCHSPCWGYLRNGRCSFSPSPSQALSPTGQGGAAPSELGTALLDLLFEAGWCLNAALESLE